MKKRTEEQQNLDKKLLQLVVDTTGRVVTNEMQELVAKGAIFNNSEAVNAIALNDPMIAEKGYGLGAGDVAYIEKDVDQLSQALGLNNETID